LFPSLEIVIAQTRCSQDKKDSSSPPKEKKLRSK
ncbi:hypothetical protein TorRG33x02_332070, partial [Trema orientale]